MRHARPALAVLALLLAGTGPASGEDRHGTARVARTRTPFADDRQAFRFVVIGDRTGRARPGVFEDALAKVDRLQPDFVINIGDLIEGNSEDPGELDREWREVTAATERLGVPFFYVPGNHDLTNEVQRSDWRRRLGADYYSFTYRDVLFLVLNTEDPPQPGIARKPLYDRYGAEAMATVFRALQGAPARAEALFAADPKLAELAARIRGSEAVAFGADQLAMVRSALARHPQVRWTFVLMHRPAWKIASPAFRQIETMLKGRNYTMLAGHHHKYAYEVRNGQDHVQLGTTGGMPGGPADDPAVVDHVMWVSMAKGAPRISNIRLDGFFDKRGPTAAAAPR